MDMFEIPKPFEQPAKKTEEKKPKSLRERVTSRLRELAQMSPEEKEAERAGYMEELKRGGKTELTPEEENTRKERQARATRLKKKP